MIRPAVMSDSERAELEGKIEQLRGVLPNDRYFDLSIFLEANEVAGMRGCFRACWGAPEENGGRKVVILGDKTPRTEVGQTLFDKGYGTKNEIKVASKISLEEALSNHLVLPFDFYNVNGDSYSVAPEIEGAVSLKKHAENNKFNFKDFKQFFTQIIDTAVFFGRKGFFHRDLSPQNLLVKKNGKLEGWITDVAAACEVKEARPDYFPTSGANTVRNPRLSFSGEEIKYEERDEAYALAQNMLVASNGEPAVKYDYANEGSWDKKNHDKAVKQAIKKLPKWARKRYGKIIYNAMAADKGYDSLADFEKDFRKASKPGLFEKLKENKALPVLGLAGILALGYGYTVYDEVAKDKSVLEKLVIEAEKYEVVSAFDGERLSTSNNLVDLDFYIFDKGDKNRKYELLYGECLGELKEPKFLHLEPGQKLSLTVKPRQKPRPGDHGSYLPPMKVKAYFEGFPAKEFNTEALMPDPTQYDPESCPFIFPEDINVPSSIPEGNHAFVVELYSHNYTPSPEKNWKDALDEIVYSEKGAISRERIPVVVGNPKHKVNINSLSLGVQPYISLSNVEDYLKTIDPNLSLEVSIPELNYHMPPYGPQDLLTNVISRRLQLPKPGDLEIKTLQVMVINRSNLEDESNEEIVNLSHFPIRGVKIGDNFYWWESALSYEGFSDKLVKYRKHAMGEIEKPIIKETRKFENNSFGKRKERIINADLKERYGSSGNIISFYEYDMFDKRSLDEIQKDSISYFSIAP